MDYNLNVGRARIQTADIVLKETSPVLRVVMDYDIAQDDNAAFANLITKYATPVNESGEGARFIKSPLRAGNTFAAYMLDTRESDHPIPVYIRLIDKFNFIARFALDTDKKGNIRVSPHRYNQDAGNTLNVDRLHMPVPEPYVAVLVLMNPDRYSPVLLAINKTTGTIFKIPTPNMHWSQATLCMGNSVVDGLRHAIATGDLLNITKAIDAWEESEWNADLTQSLPSDLSLQFLSWDLMGKYKGAKAWAKCEKTFPITDGQYTDVPPVSVAAAKFARGLAV